MATELIKVSELPVKTTDFADGDLIIVSEYNGGTYVSKSKNAFKIGVDSVGFDPSGLWNIGIAASVSGNALTIALKQKDGTTDPSSGVGRCRANFRSGTITNGGFVTVDVVSAISTIISSGSTAGFTSGSEGTIYVYLINNSGSAELAWSGSPFFNESELHSTTAEGGSGGADSGLLLYSTTARSNVAARLIGSVTATEATAGTWATSPSKIFSGFIDTSRSITGSNSYGNWEKMANGVMRQWGWGYIVGAGGSSQTVDFNLPQSFIGNYSIGARGAGFKNTEPTSPFDSSAAHGQVITCVRPLTGSTYSVSWIPGLLSTTVINNGVYFIHTWEATGYWV